ncbi:SDR family oxidoreductase [Klugiella xanthotipulae]|uniref:Short-subunit dehydrogenase n=1 Tax=Klugiella xanthotipulae TaxID=244735 RepID=A0A543HXR5_9MICO|nr:SDR family NAD(P)-dependent oxidoreductase [Klugiella xanthotipulae]TQM63153.1 hypothetical protein FB466_1407 [Klugiella xanthotipulae]
MTQTAFITGATSGIGAECARQLAATGWDLVLLARDGERLARVADRLAGRYGVTVSILSADLTTEAGLAAACGRLSDEVAPIELLVNSAGFGLAGRFHRNRVADEEQMLDLLVRAPLRLTHAAMRGMLSRGSGRIVNVASVAGFVPRGTYSAAKAWLITFCRSLNAVYGPRGVHVTALCPGFVRTEFHERMGDEMAGIPRWMWLTTEPVVRRGLRDSARGRSISVPTVRYRAIVALTRVLPSALLAERGRGSRMGEARPVSRHGANSACDALT